MQNYFTFIKAATIDLFFILLLSSPYITWSYCLLKSDPRNNIYVFDKETDILLSNISTIYIAIIFLIVLIKDVLNLSIGKKVYNIKIIDKKLNKEANWIRKTIRNIPLLIILVVELPMKILFPSARFGDMLMDTELIINYTENK